MMYSRWIRGHRKHLRKVFFKGRKPMSKTNLDIRGGGSSVPISQASLDRLVEAARIEPQPNGHVRLVFSQGECFMGAVYAERDVLIRILCDAISKLKETEDKQGA